MNKKSDGNLIWYLITGILVLLVIVAVVMMILRINPIKAFTEMLPTFGIGAGNKYQGLCRIENPQILGYESYEAGGYKLCAAMIHIKGNEDCKEDKITFDCEVQTWNPYAKNKYPISNLNFQFNEKNTIQGKLYGLKNNENYECTLTIYGKYLIMTNGKEFKTPLKFITNC